MNAIYEIVFKKSLLDTEAESLEDYLETAAWLAGKYDLPEHDEKTLKELAHFTYAVDTKDYSEYFSDDYEPECLA